VSITESVGHATIYKIFEMACRLPATDLQTDVGHAGSQHTVTVS
jgi:hypothetical protein